VKAQPEKKKSTPVAFSNGGENILRPRKENFTGKRELCSWTKIGGRLSHPAVREGDYDQGRKKKCGRRKKKIIDEEPTQAIKRKTVKSIERILRRKGFESKSKDIPAKGEIRESQTGYRDYTREGSANKAGEGGGHWKTERRKIIFS